MTNLIITLISIALIAITAVIALFALGDSFKDNSDKATFSRLTHEGMQIQGYSEIYQSTYGKAPESIQDLIDTGYLKNRPLGFASSDSENGGYEWVVAGKSVITLHENMTEERALAINKIAKVDSETVPTCNSEMITNGFIGTCSLN
jgi:hypothetical protein